MAQATIDDKDLYDESPEFDQLFTQELNEGLTEEEKEDAEWLMPMTRGLMIVTGPPRSGKDLFGNVVSWKIKRYFKGRHILRDEKPRRPYGIYTPFNERMLVEDLSRMRQVAAGDIIKTQKSLTDATGEWIAKDGQVLLQNGVLYLTEFYRYVYNRAPFNPMGILLGQIIKMWGHLDLLIIGTAQQRHELDQYSCLPFVTHEVTCQWSMTKSGTGLYRIKPTRYVGTTGAWEVTGEIMPAFIDGGRPREALNGKRYFDLYNSKSAPQIKPTGKMEL